MKHPIAYVSKPLPRSKVLRPADERAKVVVCGSEHLQPIHSNWIQMMLDKATFSMFDPYIVSRGHSETPVDVVVRLWALNNWMSMLLHYTESGPSKTKEAEKRDLRMLDESTHFIGLVDYKSEWMQWIIDEAIGRKGSGLKVKIFEL